MYCLYVYQKRRKVGQSLLVVGPGSDESTLARSFTEEKERQSNQEIVGSPVISALIDNLIPIAFKEIYHVRGVRIEITKLWQTLVSIQALLLLTDAEKQLEKDTVKLWLQNLKEVVYDGNSGVDEDEIQKKRFVLMKKYEKEWQLECLKGINFLLTE